MIRAILAAMVLLVGAACVNTAATIADNIRTRQAAAAAALCDNGQPRNDWCGCEPPIYGTDC